MSANPSPTTPVHPGTLAQTSHNITQPHTPDDRIGETTDDSNTPDHTDPAAALPHLSDRQVRALDLVLQGKTDVDIAATLGVHRRTIWVWRNLPAFRAHYDLRRRELCDAAAARILTLVGAALDTLDKQVHDRYTPTSRRAAQTLLLATAIGRHATTFPAPPARPPKPPP